MNEIYEDAINYLKYYGEKNNRKIENIAYFLDCELKSYIKLQSNWNSLKDWVFEHIDSIEFNSYDDVLNKMNELEGVDNENNNI